MSVNKIALVTGGSRGLGKNMALSLAKKGINVVLTYNSKKEDALAVAQEITALGQQAAILQLNTGDIASFDAFVEQFKQTLTNDFGTDKFDFLINNAGVGIHQAFAEFSEENFDTLMNIHFKGVFFLTQKLLPILNDGGRIVNLSSGLARFSMAGYSAYGALKAGIETLSRYMAVELGARGIAVNVVAPGAIETDFGGGMVRDNAELNKRVASITALGRAGVPDDIGGVVAFLCSEEGRWLNGQRIEVSGGMNL
ncbi:SDR family NAD(P)-dependent oxidoreductase [Mucilaginibacter auburnensis]|uniref:NAD(P)-dependent dehydrogenase (Short-subunit alcohol dehydrogenase family) n=1 Tax=Mucilaginibacter auburnensis TaxID=1457233 RepID=A0A2H9VNI9_9SPHI|nr:SDR family oxidoreductase [Mucilaginibacter auburnensis]PJJ79908.1 NAD(P)-dependent dehydrogenase (short-subunit alcohol dehydrogenase family) [Mucilaginibacter auburnensis]